MLIIEGFFTYFNASVFLLLTMLGSIDWKIELLILKLILSIMRVSVGAQDFSPEKQSLIPLNISLRFCVLLNVAV
jgi:hypothetical protein